MPNVYYIIEYNPFCQFLLIELPHYFMCPLNK